MRNIEFLRTPEENFKDLPDFPYTPNYIENIGDCKDLRMAYIDEGQDNSEIVFLCLHGQPTWSFLYRKMIPEFINAGYRAIAPDLIGFGRSDKPINEDVYTFDFHRDLLINFVEKLDLKNIALVCQDWGGILGLTLPMDMANRFTRLIVMDTIFGTGDFHLGEGFYSWRDWNNSKPDMAIERLMKRSCPHLSDKECLAYKAPFPDVKYKACVRKFPNLVPDSPDDPGALISQKAREWFKNKWSGDAFMAIGMQDPVLTPSLMRSLRKFIRGCPEPLEIKEAGHFVQEWGDIVAKKALEIFNV
jgi:haloalkane dehalogenase/tRNA(adenine34) deaminase